ncbi:MAG: hypothetical protein HC940_00800 [Acaryochloris sp. SU_5_25]|nr:hypothetical protein [Acaryochloris sp. SU_5_25]
MAIASLMGAIAALFFLNLVRSPSSESLSGSVIQTQTSEIITDSDADQASSPHAQER